MELMGPWRGTYSGRMSCWIVYELTVRERGINMSREGALTPGEVYKGTDTSGLIGRIFYELNKLKTDISIERPARGDRPLVSYSLVPH